MSISLYTISSDPSLYGVFIYQVCSIKYLIVCVHRYVLISRPSDWSDQLRVKFLEGLDAFLELLKCMQVTHTWSHSPDSYLDRYILNILNLNLSVTFRVWTRW